MQLNNLSGVADCTRVLESLHFVAYHGKNICTSIIYPSSGTWLPVKIFLLPTMKTASMTINFSEFEGRWAFYASCLICLIFIIDSFKYTAIETYNRIFRLCIFTLRIRSTVAVWKTVITYFVSSFLHLFAIIFISIPTNLFCRLGWAVSSCSRSIVIGKLGTATMLQKWLRLKMHCCSLSLSLAGFSFLSHILYDHTAQMAYVKKCYRNSIQCSLFSAQWLGLGAGKKKINADLSILSTLVRMHRLATMTKRAGTASMYSPASSVPVQHCLCSW